MASVPLTRKKDAHYHAIKATEAWTAFQAALTSVISNTLDERTRRDAQRVRETTYARGELGGS